MKRGLGLWAVSLAWVLSSGALYTLLANRRYELAAGRAALGAAALVWLFSAGFLHHSRRELARRPRFLALAWLAAAGLGYAVVAAVLYLEQDRLLFLPVSGQFTRCAAIGDEDEGGKDFEVVDTDSGNAGERVRAYVRTRPDARAWVVIFHGNAESACAAVFYARELFDLAVDFAVAEYPGYLGDDHAHASQASFARNAEAVYDYAVARARLPVIALGRSLGTGVATYLASARPVAGLVLISPYTSIADVGAYRYPFIPVRGLLHNPFPASEWAEKVQAPVLIVHGTSDHVVPLALGREEAAHFGPRARLVEYPGLGHGTIVRGDSPAWGEIHDFIRRHLPR